MAKDSKFTIILLNLIFKSFCNFHHIISISFSPLIVFLCVNLFFSSARVPVLYFFASYILWFKKPFSALFQFTSWKQLWYIFFPEENYEQYYYLTISNNIVLKIQLLLLKLLLLFYFRYVRKLRNENTETMYNHLYSDQSKTINFLLEF